MRHILYEYDLNPKKLAQIIDHTFLKPEATVAKIWDLCKEAKNYDFWSVCINPCYIHLAKPYLQDSDVKVCSVVGFPLGASTTKTKIYETKNAVKNGADEIDMVMNIGALKDQDYDFVQRDIYKVVKTAKKKLVKVILETCLLSEKEIIRACQISKEAGAHFVKTSTGFNKAGATPENVKLMREIVGNEFGVKASGGIRDLETSLEMIESGAVDNLDYFRIGTSSGINILEQVDRFLYEEGYLE